MLAVGVGNWLAQSAIKADTLQERIVQILQENKPADLPRTCEGTTEPAMKSLCLAVLLGLATVATSYPPYIQAERPPWQEAEVEQGGRPPILDTPWPPMQEVEEQQQDLSSSADIARNTFRQLLGQSLCQSYAAATGLVYPIYAVGRKCEDPSAGTCHAICKDKTLHAQETNPTIRNSLWINWRSFRIFEATPPFTSGGVGTAKLGMKTEYYVNPHVTGCGPNICCCLAHTIHAG